MLEVLESILIKLFIYSHLSRSSFSGAIDRNLYKVVSGYRSCNSPSIQSSAQVTLRAFDYYYEHQLFIFITYGEASQQYSFFSDVTDATRTCTVITSQNVEFRLGFLRDLQELKKLRTMIDSVKCFQIVQGYINNSIRLSLSTVQSPIAGTVNLLVQRCSTG